MTDVTLGFAPFSMPRTGVLVLFCDRSLSLPAKVPAAVADLVKRAAKTENFKGKHGSALVITVPHGLSVERLIVIGIGEPGKLQDKDIINLGGAAMGKVPGSTRDVAILAELPGKVLSPAQVADIALGARLRAYSFDLYKTKGRDEKPAAKKITLG